MMADGIDAFPVFPMKFPLLVITLPVVLLPLAADAQDLEAPLVAPPSGFSELPAGVLPAGNELLQGLAYSVSSGYTYDSNLFQGSGQAGSPIEDDIILSFSPGMAYRTQGSTWTLGFAGSLDYSSYLNNDDLGGLGYNTAVDGSYSQKPLTMAASLGYGLSQGVNRNYGSSYVENKSFNGSLRASYSLSAKTSIDARLGHSISVPDGGFTTTESTNFDITAMWKATPLITVGPGVSWGWQGGDTQATRETVGPLLRLSYKLSQKVALDGNFGVDFAEFGDTGRSDTSFSNRLGLNYRASSLWGMNLSLSQGTQADGASAGNFSETTAWRIGINRRIRRANLGLGLSYETNDTVTPTGTGGTGGRDFLSFDSSLSMPVFWQRAQASTFISWSQESGSREWDGFRLGISLSAAF